MKRLLALISLLAVVSVGAVCAQSDITTGAPESAAVDNFISIGPVDGLPVLLAQEPATTDSPAVENTRNEEEAPAAENTEEIANTEETKKADKPKKPAVNFGLMVGVFNPTNSATKELFDDSWVRVGIRPIPRELSERYRFTFDTSYYTMSKNYADAEGNIIFADKVKLIPITVGLLRGFNQGKDLRSYVGVNVGPYYGSFKAPSISVNEKRWGLNANVSAGVIYKDRIALEGRYEFMEKLGGYDFSAFTVSASYRIFSARM